MLMQPPPTMSMPSLVRYTFYNIPFTKDGESVYIPIHTKDVDIANLDLSKYRQYEVVTNRAFRSSQNTLVLPQNEEVNAIAYNVNYVRIAITSTEALNDYTTDKNGVYYWIDDTEFLSVLQGFTGGAVQFSISNDYIANYLMVDRDNNRVGGYVEIENRNFKTDYYARPLALPQLNASKVDFTSVAYTSRFYVVVCFTTEQGSVFQAVVDTGETTLIGSGSLQATLRYVSNIYQYRLNKTTEPINVSIKKLFALPYQWVNKFVYKPTEESFQESFLSRRTDGSTYEFNCFALSESKTTQNIPVFEFLDVPEISDPNTGDLIPPSEIWEKWILRTPSRLIEITGNPLNNKTFYFKVFVEFSNGGTGSDNINVKLFINGEFYDVSDDFAIDFAINEAALRQTQNKELAVLQGLSAAVGAIGGTVGGIASQNYFGAVQSLVSGVQSIGNLLDVPHSPAQLHAASSFINGLDTYGVFAFLRLAEANNKSDLGYFQMYYGWSFANSKRTAYTIDSATQLDGLYVKFKSVLNVVTKRKSEIANSFIASKFLQGVRLEQL